VKPFTAISDKDYGGFTRWTVHRGQGQRRRDRWTCARFVLSIPDGRATDKLRSCKRLHPSQGRSATLFGVALMQLDDLRIFFFPPGHSGLPGRATLRFIRHRHSIAAGPDLQYRDVMGDSATGTVIFSSESQPGSGRDEPRAGIRPEFTVIAADLAPIDSTATSPDLHQVSYSEVHRADRRRGRSAK